VAMLSRRLAQNSGSADVGLDECERIHQRAVNVRLGRKVDDGVRRGRERVDELRVADVAVHEPVAGLAFELHQVGEVAGIRQLVEHRDVDVRTRRAQKADEVGADESSRPCDQEPLQRTRHLIGGPAVQSYPIVGSSCGILPSSSGA